MEYPSTTASGPWAKSWEADTMAFVGDLDLRCERSLAELNASRGGMIVHRTGLLSIEWPARENCGSRALEMPQRRKK